ncbi:MAG: preprotein translocase subunit YajC [Flavobacteriales bacterium]|nr:MAG: preprotein translocase subunit YajC [Flavobacteriales bacterium]
MNKIMDNTIFLFLIAIVFLIFIVLPQSRRNKKEKNFLNNLKRGDRIITKSGIHARVIEFDNKNNTCVVETMAGKLKIEKAAISLEMSSKLNV